MLSRWWQPAGIPTLRARQRDDIAVGTVVAALSVGRGRYGRCCLERKHQYRTWCGPQDETCRTPERKATLGTYVGSIASTPEHDQISAQLPSVTDDLLTGVATPDDGSGPRSVRARLVEHRVDPCASASLQPTVVYVIAGFVTSIRRLIDPHSGARVAYRRHCRYEVLKLRFDHVERVDSCFEGRRQTARDGKEVLAAGTLVDSDNHPVGGFDAPRWHDQRRNASAREQPLRRRSTEAGAPATASSPADAHDVRADFFGDKRERFCGVAPEDAHPRPPSGDEIRQPAQPPYSDRAVVAATSTGGGRCVRRKEGTRTLGTT
jgi:hypothetical protein